MTQLACKKGKRGGRLSRWIRGGMVALALTAGVGGVGSAPLYAQAEDSDMDGRLEGYESKVGIEKDSTTPLWFLFFFLTVVGVSALFKSAKRE